MYKNRHYKMLCSSSKSYLISNNVSLHPDLLVAKKITKDVKDPYSDSVHEQLEKVMKRPKISFIVRRSVTPTWINAMPSSKLSLDSSKLLPKS